MQICSLILSAPTTDKNCSSTSQYLSQYANDDACVVPSGQVHLLEPEESLRLNLLLARLEAMPEELAQAVIEGDITDLSPSAVQLLIDAMPPQQQVSSSSSSDLVSVLDMG